MIALDDSVLASTRGPADQFLRDLPVTGTNGDVSTLTAIGGSTAGQMILPIGTTYPNADASITSGALNPLVIGPPTFNISNQNITAATGAATTGLTNGGSGLLNSRQQPVEPEIPQRYAGRSTGVETATIAIIRNSRTPERHFDVLAAGAANYPVCVDWRKHTADRTPSSTVTSAPPAAPR